ncbi:hypothetical protein CSOJ01_07433 [Colletotrichum sojae]|uniref:Uncharacterized protein n=1 Tax=Colletotrichum sojae TaxID=2175907 RepID=A0A8H6MUA9_9PEZI|nr:hypothetical protein CSOJ01_07433 [Colletotrichum sojae]
MTSATGSSGGKKELPAWYYRVSKLCMYQGYPETQLLKYDAFDEDISDFECDLEWDDRDCDCETKECAHGCQCEEKNCEHACKCEDLPVEVCEDGECNCTAVGCWHDEEVIRDDESERSYNGPGKNQYYELKKLRHRRKRERREEAREEASALRRAIAHDRKKEDEVRAAYEALKKMESDGEMPPLDSLAYKRFRLYSAKHTAWLGYKPGSRYIDFVPSRSSGLDGSECPEAMKKDKRLLDGNIYLDPDAGGDLGPFRMPTQLGRKRHVVPIDSDQDGAEGKVTVQFVSNDHLILRISRDVVTESWESDCSRPAPETTPEVFELMGIGDGEEKSREKIFNRNWDCVEPIVPQPIAPAPAMPKSRRKRRRRH